jgi:hypothetical protein
MDLPKTRRTKVVDETTIATTRTSDDRSQQENGFTNEDDGHNEVDEDLNGDNNESNLEDIN